MKNFMTRTVEERARDRGSRERERGALVFNVFVTPVVTASQESGERDGSIVHGRPGRHGRIPETRTTGV